jgi:hypothetical protein
MRITTVRAYREVVAKIQSLSDAGEGTAEARELAALVAAAQDWERTSSQGDASAPGRFHTARRPGQPGEEAEHRAGPNPRSSHPTGPHPPYDPDDLEGTAAEKHDSGGAEALREGEPADRPSGTVRAVDLK